MIKAKILPMMIPINKDANISINVMEAWKKSSFQLFLIDNNTKYGDGKIYGGILKIKQIICQMNKRDNVIMKNLVIINFINFNYPH